MESKSARSCVDEVKLLFFDTRWCYSSRESCVAWREEAQMLKAKAKAKAKKAEERNELAGGGI